MDGNGEERCKFWCNTIHTEQLWFREVWFTSHFSISIISPMAVCTAPSVDPFQMVYRHRYRMLAVVVYSRKDHRSRDPVYSLHHLSSFVIFLASLRWPESGLPFHFFISPLLTASRWIEKLCEQLLLTTCFRTRLVPFLHQLLHQKFYCSIIFLSQVRNEREKRLRSRKRNFGSSLLDSLGFKQVGCCCWAMDTYRASDEGMEWVRRGARVSQRARLEFAFSPRFPEKAAHWMCCTYSPSPVLLTFFYLFHTIW